VPARRGCGAGKKGENLGEIKEAGDRPSMEGRKRAASQTPLEKFAERNKHTENTICSGPNQKDFA